MVLNKFVELNRINPNKYQSLVVKLAKLHELVTLIINKFSLIPLAKDDILKTIEIWNKNLL